MRPIEFLIADLALSALSVPTFTVASASVLSPVLESHPPSVIITDAEFLPHLLELIYDAHESEHHTIVVVGDADGAKLPKLNNVKILNWDAIEAEGAAATKSPLPLPGLLTSLDFSYTRHGLSNGTGRSE